MARPKRMGAYNALDDLVPGPPHGRGEEQEQEQEAGMVGWLRPRLEPVPDPPPPPARRRRPDRPRALSALDDLLPGPSTPPRQPPSSPPPLRSAGRHLGAWNPLDDLRAAPPSAPGPAGAKARLSFRMPADVVEAARDAVAHLAGTPDRITLSALAERALRTELARLAAAHNHGRPFRPRVPKPRP
jgi:hypothetical protein